MADDAVAKLGEILHTAAETHHVVFGIVHGADEDWASWYSDWLLNLSRLPDVLRTRPVRSELTYELVRLDKEYTQRAPADAWEPYYARELMRRFGTA